jgi:hypothetical protein
MTVIEQIGLAWDLLSKDHQAQEKKEHKILVQHTQLTALNHKIQRALQCATATNNPEDWTRYRILEDEETVLQTSMESCLDSPMSVQDLVCDACSSKKSSIESSTCTMSAVNKILHSFSTIPTPARKKHKTMTPPASIFVQAPVSEKEDYTVAEKEDASEDNGAVGEWMLML